MVFGKGYIVSNDELIMYRDYNDSLSKMKIPKNVKTIIFGHNFDQEIEIGDIPDFIENLFFGVCFNKKIRPDVIPNKVSKVVFGDFYDRVLEIGSIPNSVIHLSFGSSYNRIIKPFVLPSSIRTINFGNKFDKPLLKNSIPESVKYIKFGYNFSQSLIDLPETVETVEFVRLTEIAINSLPMIRHLIIFDLNKIRMDNLPMSLESLTLLSYNNSELENINKIPFGCKVRTVSKKEEFF